MDSDGHAIAHAFGAHIVVGPVRDVGELAVGVGSAFEIDGLRLRIAVEELLKGGLQFGVDLAGLVAVFSEEVAVAARGKRALFVGPGCCALRLREQSG